jgi:uncharacterized protein (DUF885 family)
LTLIVFSVCTLTVSNLAWLECVSAADDPVPPLVTPTLEELDPSIPTMHAVIERFKADLDSLERFEGGTKSPTQRDRRAKLCRDWQTLLKQVPFENLDQDGRIDYLLLRTKLQRELRQVEYEQAREQEIDALVPFSNAIYALNEMRLLRETIEGKRAGEVMADLSKSIPAELERLRAQADLSVSASVGRRAVERLDNLTLTLQRWHKFYNQYDPLFTWWTEAPYKDVERDLRSYREYLESRFVGRDKDQDKIVGEPIGTEALIADLKSEMIPYTPQELVEIANQEFAFCEAEYRKAAQALGYGDDWRKALEHVKKLHVEPGKQPEMIRQLAEEAVAFLDQRELVTIPELCRRVWRMEMMTPERQKVNPYFTGGEVISVSFPTSSMDHADKLMSLRGNNIHFSRATVHHELIPGHHLQLYMADRYRTHRELFRTPFLVEGWALYWEMLLWDLDFPQSPEDRIGMLFWRSHRCARIIFSLSYHMGTMTEQEAVDFLVERVGHERRNAEAEVRRSVQGEYEPLYQAAYMLGGLQIRKMREELVDSGKMQQRAFHDAILRENSIPIELIRASLGKLPLTEDYETNWRFYDRGAANGR